MRELLRAAAGADGPMPADVTARVDAALARARAELDEAGGAAPGAAPGARVASLAGHRSHPARWRRGLAVAVAAGVVAAGVGAVLQLDPGGGAGSSTSAGSAADSAAESGAAAAAAVDVPVLRSGADYAADAAVAAVGASLTGPATGTRDGTGGTGPAETPGGGGDAPDALPGVDAERNLKSSALPPTGTPDESQRPAAEQALACARAAGVDAASVAAVQVAAWRSQPAALVVERPTAGEAGEVVVVALGCTPGDEPLNRVELPAVQAPASP
ncbi:hypothetical protein MN205_18850 [Kineococcus sp. TRM81007]|uniref:hypothetical protein n=1 Tax=Kineococcus sp. TRM81007 TaxID=2925831 RepID=UPI001F59A40F|nr:hypothetical protein [Kineococcus sp. TRM81007]MCI2240527.1 hypothetical protein [Kineococcus sp. TRM81007]